MRSPVRFPHLALWSADPLTTPAAMQLQQQAEQRLMQRLRRGVSCISCRWQQLIAAATLQQPLLPHYQSARALCRSRRADAITELLYGQLLLTRRLPEAHHHLQRGFRLAAPLLASSDYFTLLSRHQQLQRLPTTDPPSPAMPLAQLLTTAAIIAQLQRR